MKKFFMLIAAALTSIASFSQGFSYEYEGVSLKYRVIDQYNDQGVTVLGLTDPESLSLNGGYLDIPSKVFWYDRWYDVTEIQDKAFEDISALRVLTLPNTLITVGRNAFKGCSLEDLVIPNSVYLIQPYAFYGNPIEELILEEGALDIDIKSTSFDFDKITYAYLGRPYSEYYGQQMTGLKFLMLGNSITEIPDHAFAGLKNLSELTFGSSVRSIGKSAFEGCPIGNILFLSPALESIGERAFANIAVKTIYMGPALRRIGASAFEGGSLTQVYISAEWPPLVGENAFSGDSWNLGVQGKLEEYKSASGWKDATAIGNLIGTISKMEYSGPEVFTGQPGNRFDLSNYVKTLPRGRHLFWRTTDPDIATVNTDGIMTLQNGITDPEAECEIITETIYADAPIAKIRVSGNKFAGIGEIASDNSETAAIDFAAPYEVYSIDGRRAGNSIDGLAKGIYVIRQGNNSKKFIAR